jgi:hypothetical protein
MAKRIHPSGTTPLDGEVEAFLRRLGDPGRERPLSYVTSYTVRRSIDEPHRLVIEFITDAEFDAAVDDMSQASAAQRVQLRQQGWLPPERVSELRALAEKEQHGDFGAETVQDYILAVLDDTPRQASAG